MDEQRRPFPLEYARLEPKPALNRRLTLCGGLALLATGHGLGMREPELSVPVLVAGALLVGWVVPLTGWLSTAAAQNVAAPLDSPGPVPAPVQGVPPVRYWLMPVWLAAVIVLVSCGVILGASIVLSLLVNHR